MARNAKTVEDLIAEIEPAPPGGRPPSPPALPPASGPSGGFAVRLGLALLILSFGVAAGWVAAGVRTSSAAAPGAKRSVETRSDLLAAGWRELTPGVFSRWCGDWCRPPRLFGGGTTAAMEVHCLERPCGQISAVFDVVDGRGQVIGEIPRERMGLQGERLQLVLESERPESRRFVLRTFSARARLE